MKVFKYNIDTIAKWFEKPRALVYLAIGFFVLASVNYFEGRHVHSVSYAVMASLWLIYAYLAVKKNKAKNNAAS